MSMPPPAVTTITQAHSTHGSVGPLIAVLVVVIILGVIAGMIGRLCSGKPIMGCGQYDIGSCAERKFSSCIDGTISPPLPRPNVSEASASTPNHQEREQENPSPSNSNPPPPKHVDS
ncbi:Alpha-protein kinase 1-like [Melia azedarach]|uniref:Alpha-protein kinase 1-like n=1 Tax=Melia azedarach TaxID=155640 RepID=A0ACC1WS44_MELAZ|nr:Alpha-protein kinase 1-like [Melia azedarach]